MKICIHRKVATHNNNSNGTIKKWSCIGYRQPAPDPHGSRTGNLLSTISWHLNLQQNLALTLL